MKDLILSIFGEYTPITYDVISGDTVNTVVASGFAGVDWAYIAGILLFSIVLLSFFKLLGVVLKNG